MKLDISFYLREDTLQIARDLIGKSLVHWHSGQRLVGRIVETEAYLGAEDKACHAFGGRRTARTETMFAAGGIAYVYLCYGVHDMLNIVTGPENHPHVVLIRALQPLEGTEMMLKNRSMNSVQPKLTAGPGALCKAMGITRSMNGIDLYGQDLWLEESPNSFENDLICSARVGVAYAGEDALLPYRFRLRDNAWTSPAK